MKYLSLMILAVLVMALITGCATNAPLGPDQASGESVQSSQVTSEAGTQIDTEVLDDTDTVEIGEMI